MKSVVLYCLAGLFAVTLSCCSSNDGSAAASTKDSTTKVGQPSGSDTLSAKPIDNSGILDSSWSTAPANTEGLPEIPIAQIEKYLNRKIDSAETYAFRVVKTINNRYGQFQIIRADCSAGGFCSYFHLFQFAPDGRFIKSQEIGEEIGDLGFGRYFGYKIMGDTLLLTCKTEYDENDKLVDSVVKRIELR